MKVGTSPLGNRGMMGHWDGNGWLGVKVEVGNEGGGGGIISLRGGRQKLRFNLALPSLWDSKWNTAGCPSLQRLRAWLS